jgi:hypothetical protein
MFKINLLIIITSNIFLTLYFSGFHSITKTICMVQQFYWTTCNSNINILSPSTSYCTTLHRLQNISHTYTHTCTHWLTTKSTSDIVNQNVSQLSHNITKFCQIYTWWLLEVKYNDWIAKHKLRTTGIAASCSHTGLAFDKKTGIVQRTLLLFCKQVTCSILR